jgi:hypothetical protein
MAMTIDEQERQREHAAVLAELRRRRAEVAGKLAKIDAKIGQLGDANFRERLGSRKVSEMTVKEKAEVVDKVGFEGFAELLGVR